VGSLRSIWNGTITFGTVAVPIKMRSATEDTGVHFHQVDARDGARIEHKRFCPKDGKARRRDECACIAHAHW
jgi:DNA end-binding protein Ku